MPGMTIEDLQELLRTAPGGTLDIAKLGSDGITSLFADFLPGLVFGVESSQPGTVGTGTQTQPAMVLVGTVAVPQGTQRVAPALVPDFDGMRATALFYVQNGFVEVVLTFDVLADLSRTFPSLAEKTAFTSCAFCLHSCRPDPLGPDFDAEFGPPKNAKRGLTLSATLNLSQVDATLADFGVTKDRLQVDGTVEVDEGNTPRMRLTSTEHLEIDVLETIHLVIEYRYASGTLNGIQQTRERLTYHLGLGSTKEPVALAIDFAPNMLTDRIVIESDWQGASPPSFLELMSMLPDASASLQGVLPGPSVGEQSGSPTGSETLSSILAPLENLRLAFLRFELESSPLSLCAVHTRVELPAFFTIAKYKDKDLLTFGDLKLDLTVTLYKDDWGVLPYIMGTLTVADGRLTGIVDLANRSFFCVLDDDSTLDIKKLLDGIDLHGLLPDDLSEFNFTRFEIWGDIGGGSYGFDIATTIGWELPSLGPTGLKLEDLFLRLECSGGSFDGTVGGSVVLFDMTFGIVAQYNSTAGLMFELRALNIGLRALVVDILGQDHAEAASGLPDVTIPSLDLQVWPKTGEFTFAGQVTVDADRLFGIDGADFECDLKLRLWRDAKSDNLPTVPEPQCDIQMNCTGVVPVNGQNLTSTLHVTASRKDGQPLDVTATGSLNIGDVSFGAVFHTGKDSTLIAATWPDPSGDADRPVLNFRKVAAAIGISPDNVIGAELFPTLTGLTVAYDFANSRLLLAGAAEKTTFTFLTCSGGEDKKERTYAFALNIQEQLEFADLPLVGSTLRSLDASSISTIGIDGIAAAATTQKLVDADTTPFTSMFGVLRGGGHSDDLDRSEALVAALNGLERGGTIRINLRTSANGPTPLEIRFGGDSGNAEKTIETSPTGLPAAPAPGHAPGTSGSRPRTDNLNSTITWKDVGRTIGPLTINRIGGSYGQGRITIALDAGFAISVLSLDLVGLSLRFPVPHTGVDFELTPDLEGMTLAYQSGPLTISGGFYKVETPGPDLQFEYNGEARIAATDFALSAIGSLAEFKDHDKGFSLFLFAVLNYPLGGPPFFFVTGVAAGFGYNRSLKRPTLDELPAFPLVAAAMPTDAHPDPFGSAAGDPAAALQVMDSYVTPAEGENWLAAGIKFTSFKMLESFALLTVSFGTRLEVALLGLSALRMPAGAPEPLSFAELAIEVVFIPDDGVLMAVAELTPQSYVFSRACHLTGGFAFYLWLKDSNKPAGPRSGDFVLTLGGYNSRFVPPDYYPTSVPRLGASWHVNDNLSIKGGLYFALTPSVVMAGGALNANFQSGNLRAWFDAEVDFLLTWAPFHYEAWLGLHIGASYTLGSGITSFTVDVHIGADLHLWGPAFSGTATLDLYVCSVTIRFGDTDKRQVDALQWGQFREEFLPSAIASAGTMGTTTSSVTPTALEAGNAHAAPPSATENAPIPTDTYCLLRITCGLLKDLTKEKQDDGYDVDYVVSPGRFALVTSSIVPCTSVELVTGSDQSVVPPDCIPTPFGVAPVGLGNGQLTSRHKITFSKDGTTDQPLKVNWLQPVYSYLPKAVWGLNGTATPSLKDVRDGAAEPTLKVLSGTTIQPPIDDSVDQTGKIPVGTLRAGTVEIAVAFFAAAEWPTADDFARTTVWEQLQQTNTTDVSAKRAGMLDAIRRQKVQVRSGSEINTDFQSQVAADKAALDASIPAPRLQLLGEVKAP
jgi:hypothetical protein